MKGLISVFDKLRQAENELGLLKGEEPFFRGQSDETWHLETSLNREKRTRKLSDDEHREIESNFYFEFRARAQELQNQQLSAWDWMFMMRHHRLPSRLLDWTEIVGFAIFFALEGWTGSPGTKPCIWVLNPYELNERNWGVRDLVVPDYLAYEYDEDDEITIVEEYELDDYLAGGWDFEWDDPVAIYPQQKNRRQHVQRGWFTVQGNNDEPLNLANPKCVRKVCIEPDEISDLKHALESFGFDRYLVYPDLDNLSAALAEKNRRDDVEKVLGSANPQRSERGKRGKRIPDVGRKAKR